MWLGYTRESLHFDSLPGQQRSARMRHFLVTRPHRPFKSTGQHVIERCGSRASIGTDRRPGTSRCDGAVLCIGSCRDLPDTRSINRHTKHRRRRPPLGRSRAVSEGLGGPPAAIHGDGLNSQTRRAAAMSTRVFPLRRVTAARSLFENPRVARLGGCRFCQLHAVTAPHETTTARACARAVEDRTQVVRSEPSELSDDDARRAARPSPAVRPCRARG